MNRKWFRLLTLLATALLLAATGCLRTPKPPSGPVRLAILLDDAGMETNNATALWDLPRPVTVAIIPGTPHVAEYVAGCRRKGFEFIAHIPMEPFQTGRDYTPVIGVLYTPEQNRGNLAHALDLLPGIRGINNHKGSRATGDRAAMCAVMGELKARGLFMVDSRTDVHTVVEQVAKEYGVPCLANDQFLDGIQEREPIEKKLERLLTVARHRGYAVGIGHVTRPQTLPVLKRFMESHPDVEFMGIEALLRQTTTVHP